MTGGPVELVVEDDRWLEHLPDMADAADRGATMALSVAGLAPAAFEIAVLACDNARIADLNAEHRNSAGPTNVLSWPALDLAPERPGLRPAAPPEPPGEGAIFLGDVAIARQTCIEEAKTAAIPLKTHVIHLILHSVLHLLGYDHLREEDACLMEGMESRAMLAAGLPDPYSSPRDGPA